MAKYLKPEDIKGDDLVYYIERHEGPFAAHIIGGGYGNDSNVKKEFGIYPAPKTVHHGHYIFTPRSYQEKFGKQVEEKVKDPKYIDSVVKNCEQAGHNIINSLIEISKNAENVSSYNELASLLEDYYQKTQKYCSYYVVAAFQKPMTKLAESVAEKYAKDSSERENIFKLITSPSKPTRSDKEQDDFLTLLIEQQKGQDVEKKVEKHSKKYGWLAVRYLKGNPWSIDDIKQRIEGVKEVNADEKLELRLEERARIDSDVTKFINSIDQEERDFVRHVRDIVYLRTRRAEYLDEASAHILPLLYKVADLLHITYDDMLYLTPPEVVNSLKLQKGLSDELRANMLERREDFVSIHPGDGSSIIFSGRDLSDFISTRPVLNKDIATKQKEVSGDIAFKGSVQGTAKIVRDSEDLEKVSIDDILVTINTFPHFIAAMERAKAFVTDEGGILCHAAIVAREMQKPCIIGTKIATQVLKDGDLVEVDANNGVVKILSPRSAK